MVKENAHNNILLYKRTNDDTGGTPMVEPETFAFLAELKLNNRKAWMDAHRPERDDAMRNFTGIAITLHDYAHRFDHAVADAAHKPKQSYTKFFQDPRARSGPGLFRTGVDVFANAGQPTEDVGYYLHIEPGNCHAGAGLFEPSKPALVRLRRRLIDDPDGLEEVLSDPDFCDTFADGIISRNASGPLPDGIPSDAPAAPYLRMEGVGCHKALSDDALHDDDVIDDLIAIFRAASPLVRYFE
jgi:uncharacterized protein (TIGR02453 family)